MKKVKIMLMAIMLILSNFMPILSNVKAANVGEKVNLVSLGECPHDLGVNNGYVVTNKVGYYQNGEFYPAFSRWTYGITRLLVRDRGNSKVRVGDLKMKHYWLGRQRKRP